MLAAWKRLARGPRRAQKKDILESGLFDAEYYRRGNPDVVRAAMDPLDHYVKHGWREGRQPSEAFDGLAYLEANPDVAAAGVDPLLHWIRAGRLEGRRREPDPQEVAKRAILESGLFDAEYYRYDNLDVAFAETDPLDHYVRQGWREGRRPSAEFNLRTYLEENPDIAAAGIDPLLHWIRTGSREDRHLPPCYLTRIDRPAALEKLRASGLFDAAYYLRQCPIVRDANLDPMLHYLISGYKSFFEPSAEISMRSYIAATPDVREVDCNPLLHFIDSGRAVGGTAFTEGSRTHWIKGSLQPALPDDSVQIERLAGTAFFGRFGFRFEVRRHQQLHVGSDRRSHRPGCDPENRISSTRRIDHNSDLRRTALRVGVPRFARTAPQPLLRRDHRLRRRLAPGIRDLAARGDFLDPLSSAPAERRFR